MKTGRDGGKPITRQRRGSHTCRLELLRWRGAKRRPFEKVGRGMAIGEWEGAERGQQNGLTKRIQKRGDKKRNLEEK